MTERKYTLTVYLQVGEKGDWYPQPRLVKASVRSSVKSEPDTVSTIRLDLVLPETVFRAVRPQQTITVTIDPEKVSMVEVRQEDLS